MSRDGLKKIYLIKSAGYEFDAVVGKQLLVAKRRNQQLDWSDFA